MIIPKDMIAGSIHRTNNYGDIKVVSYKDCMNVVVKFVGTGFVTSAQAGDVRIGAIKDKLYPNVSGVGFTGDGKHLACVNRKNTKEYDAWNNMIRRCYDPKSLEKDPAYNGCSVVKEWFNFQVFAEWHKENYIDGYALDKDIKVKGNRIYSPDTCLFVTVADNSVEAKAKSYKFTSPDGDLTEIYNMTGFCRANNLTQSSMSKVNTGARNHHKGWVKA